MSLLVVVTAPACDGDGDLKSARNAVLTMLARVRGARLRVLSEKMALDGRAKPFVHVEALGLLQLQPIQAIRRGGACSTTWTAAQGGPA